MLCTSSNDKKLTIKNIAIGIQQHKIRKPGIQIYLHIKMAVSYYLAQLCTKLTKKLHYFYIYAITYLPV